MITKTEIQSHLIRLGVSYQDFKNYAGKTISDFKATREYRDEFLAADNTFQTEDAYNAAAMLTYEVLVSNPKRSILDVKGVWELLDEQDRNWIKIAIFRQIVFFTKNGTLYENITGQSIQTSTFNFQSDTSRNLISDDILGTYAKVALDNSQIKKYKLFDSIEESRIYIRNSKGIIEFCGTIDEAIQKGKP